MYYSVPASGLNKLPPQPGLHRQLRGAPVSSRRDRGVLRSQVRDLRAATCTSGGFVPIPRTTSTAIAGESRSRIPSRFKATSGSRSPSYEAFYERAKVGGTGTESGRRHAATQQARVVSALLHVGNQSKDSRLQLLVVWPDRQHEIGPHSSSTTLKGDLHVESVSTRNRDAGRDDGQPGVRHDRAGADANLALEEGRTIPGGR